MLGLDDLFELPTVRAHPQMGKLRLTKNLPRRPGVYLFRDRTLGSSKMSSRIVVEALVLVTWWGVRGRIRARRNKANHGKRPNAGRR